MNALLLTVWHTGTKYFLKGLEQHYASMDGRASYSHLNHAWRRKAERADVVYTTYRDPYRVAASWVNRGKFEGKGHQAWNELWWHYAELESFQPIILVTGGPRIQHGIEFPVNPINTSTDRRGLHKALDEGNVEYFYRKVGKHTIEHALNCSAWARQIINGHALPGQNLNPSGADPLP